MKLSIDQTLFDMAFRRDLEYHEPFDCLQYLDLETGNVLCVYNFDHVAEMYDVSIEENRALSEMVDSNPDLFAEIPGLHHGDYHDMLISFINSDWTDDENLKEEVRACYDGSIGRWIDKACQVDKSGTVLDNWDAYQAQEIESMVRDFFKKLNVEHEFY